MNFETFFEMSRDLCVISGLSDGLAHAVNQAVLDAFGYPRDELMAVPFTTFMHPEDRARIEADRVNIVGKVSKSGQDLEARYIVADGSHILVHWRLALQGDYIYAVGRDVSDVRKREERLHQSLAVNLALREKFKQLACMDELTQLGNRREAESLLRQQVSLCRRAGVPLTVSMLDIDHFKKVNDQHGHAGGDLVLKALAQLLKSTIRESDVAFRWGGEEFLLMMPGVDLAGGVAACERIREALRMVPMVAPVTVSFGVADGLIGSSGIDDALKLADARLYKAKVTRDSIVSD